MGKKRSVFVCQDCGSESARWLGRCPECGEWNTMVEEIRTREARVSAATAPVDVFPLTEVGCSEEGRFSTGLKEFDRVLGGGLVPGSLAILGGDPGIGKSTLLLQVSGFVALEYGRVLYVTGEESPAQIRLRAERVGAVSPNLFVAAASDPARVEELIPGIEPVLIIIDSIQTMAVPDLESPAGSVGQVRECAWQFLRIAKKSSLPVLLVGHVTKARETTLAGPQTLQHTVDAVLQFEGERHYAYRVLRSTKNRFGSTHEMGLFKMTEGGLVEVPSPSEVFLADRDPAVSGSIVVAGVEGTRPLLAEVQALVVSSSWGNPRRMVSGLDHNRVSLIIAVLERRAGLFLGDKDVYLKLAGGLRLDDPGVDLGAAVAIASSLREAPVAAGAVVIGEVDLAGGVRGVSRVAQRAAEASRLGFTRCIVPRKNRGELTSRDLGGLEVVGVENVAQAIEVLLER